MKGLSALGRTAAYTASHARLSGGHSTRRPFMKSTSVVRFAEYDALEVKPETWYRTVDPA
eukprot:CAMPEP_0170161086 /NCGR_PEP_ID=MMETSP0033_2-20121228/75213_1 /TAXON_ID=195969 /ORGANISM="Dolichomastix tenuilepis, Strain CCMP3274" /LENGTH=59 /DNA_ID=CAMNT_0010398679 /DNA_START=17 /DNA_END=192 /DNA_ORIENTATION=-